MLGMKYEHFIKYTGFKIAEFSVCPYHVQKVFSSGVFRFWRVNDKRCIFLFVHDSLIGVGNQRRKFGNQFY